MPVAASLAAENIGYTSPHEAREKHTDSGRNYSVLGAEAAAATGHAAPQFPPHGVFAAAGAAAGADAGAGSALLPP